MGSIGNSNPWTPYDSYRDCSQGICSRFCPQFCYLIFPPPPSDDDSGTPFSPLIIAIIGVLASAFILVSYYTIVTRFCKRRNDRSSRVENQENRDEIAHDQWQVASTGLDEALIRTITICKYQKGDGLIEGTECAVCLSEFEEGESLRLLPKCSHAFHLPCIDTWLKSHSNCPLCRANVVSLAQPSPPPLPSPQTSSALNTNTYEFQPPNDLILVVENQEVDCGERVVVRFVNDDDDEDDQDVSPKSPVQENINPNDSEIRDENTGNDEESTVKQIKRSISFGTFSCQTHPIISDVLKIEEIAEDLQVKGNQPCRGIGCSKGSRDVGLVPSPVSTKRSIPSGRFMFTIHDQAGKNSMLPN